MIALAVIGPTPGAETSRWLACEFFVPGDNPCLDGIDLLAQCVDMVECLGNRRAGFGRQEIAVDLVHSLAELGNPLNSFRRDDAKFRQ